MHDFDELVAFDAIMASGSMTQSAQSLGLAKSTLSRRIAQLESRLGQPLLRRQANRLIPTEAGLVFHDYCREMLTLADRSHEALAELSGKISGRVTIEVHVALTRSWLAPVMDAFMTRYPQVELTLHARETPPRAPDSYFVHVWLGPAPESGLKQEPLGRLTRGLYASPDYLARHGTPEHPRELSEHAWIDLLGTTRKGLTLHHPDQREVHFQPPHSRLRVDLPVLHVDAIARGQGIGLLPHWIVAKREAHHPGELVPCLERWQPEALPVTLLYAYGHQPRRVSTLLDFLRQAVPAAWQAQPEIA
ncbi:LysR family transcriptional regulator [Halomonas urumqiensis]|uniref:LysR family transcriptional regulator n=1 Tax=Halomonas urumqiensis TaxID=1684789 RepID=A0A2N7UC93_9GAMM|nr:LysR family transcriptional regulator [Halomonas urumqiensis]PMR78063.1 LysR family transcriptional regulator [Halomonas urumqiensis]PTB03214.1 LysR family transcriptional regulator [Halomonas urumqiensis]GHE20634.1 LysR family transcriptional regulator [Halomonas urumqiensis]